jgi:hypothetical protein
MQTGVKNKIIFQAFIYTVLMTVFAFFWANNFTSYIHLKGNDFEYCVGFCVALSYLSNFCYYIVLQKINILFFLWVPIATAVFCIPVGFFIMMVFKISGTPAQITYIYTFSYLVISLLAIFFTFKKKLLLQGV